MATMLRRRTQLRCKPRRRRPGATDWPALRSMLYERAGGRCERCGGRLPAFWEAHHRRRRSQGGRDALANLAALCPDCHTLGADAVHRGLRQARADGWLVSRAADPAAVPVRLHDGRMVLLTPAGGYVHMPRVEVTR